MRPSVFSWHSRRSCATIEILRAPMLLTGFRFDCGLFKLATGGATFGILLTLGSGQPRNTPSTRK